MVNRASFQDLVSWLRSQGPKSPAELMARFEVSQPTLFRWVKNAPHELIAFGSPRNRKIAALRNIRGLGASLPIFRITSEGEIVQAGDLLTLAPSATVFVSQAAALRTEIFPGLPFFLDDVRPQGFLGRTFGVRHSDLRLPPRIIDWSNDDILEAIARRGEDLSGDLLIGAESFQRYQLAKQDRANEINVADRDRRYPELAQAALDGHPAGSSAGGEHPKFCAALKSKDGRLTAVLVKFSPQGETFSAQRWSDLLVCEFLALETLREHGIDAAQAKLIQAGGRTFLETIRFDRAGPRGRVGVLSLAALENEWVGRGENWAVSSASLARGGRLSADDLETVRFLECFGRLIANSDRHSGNLSFFWSPEDKQVRLAPVYDMLPMLYAPINGEDSRKTFVAPTCEPALLDAWKKALPLAKKYWVRVVEDSRVSGGFKKIVREIQQTLESDL